MCWSLRGDWLSITRVCFLKFGANPLRKAATKAFTFRHAPWANRSNLPALTTGKPAAFDAAYLPISLQEIIVTIRVRPSYRPISAAMAA